MALQSKLIRSKLSKLSALGLSFILLVSCGGEKNITHHSVVVVDITASDPALIPTSSAIIDMLKKRDRDPSEGITVSFALLDDLSGSAFMEESVKPASGNSAMENPVKRKREVEQFYNELEGKIASRLANTEVDRKKSKIYIKLCKSLQRLIESKANIKEILIYSDLLENSELASFYREAQLQAAANNPEKFYNDHFSKSSCALPELNGINVHFYVMRTGKTDIAVQKAEKFWVELFRARGAKIFVN